MPEVTVEAIPSRCANTECPNRSHEGQFARVTTDIPVGPPERPHRHISLWMCGPCATAFAEALSATASAARLTPPPTTETFASNIEACDDHTAEPDPSDAPWPHLHQRPGSRRLVCLGFVAEDRHGALVEVTADDQTETIRATIDVCSDHVGDPWREAPAPQHLRNALFPSRNRPDAYNLLCLGSYVKHRQNEVVDVLARWTDEGDDEILSVRTVRER